MPVIGIWNAADPTGTLPTVAATGAFNSAATGTTTLSTQTAHPQQLRIAIADQRGDGRPDFAYQARILYADSISPSTVPSLGGPVTVNGLPATVTAWTSNSITPTVPPLRAATAVAADVTVRDLTTGSTTTMTSALNYAAPQPTLILVPAPSGQIFTGSPAATTFAVRAVLDSGVTPIPNTTVTLSVTTGQTRLEACAACTTFTATAVDPPNGSSKSSAAPASPSTPPTPSPPSSCASSTPPRTPSPQPPSSSTRP
ncbi:hypothetical protein [Edaphobacter aggregans]|uniref:hypothetical protein n=1 Tax=Edaphobacter aggregans TaxID=570835 RepID=UPI000556CC69|nr:hypothetical protein [Edaphobacter aggregans]